MTRNQIAYQTLLEQGRSNRSNEALKNAEVSETARSNLAKETETNRANIAKESETHRANVANETETNRSNLAREQETHRSNIQNESIKWAQHSEQARANRANEAIGSLNASANVRNAASNAANAATNAFNAAESQRAHLESERLTEANTQRQAQADVRAHQDRMTSEKNQNLRAQLSAAAQVMSGTYRAMPGLVSSFGQLMKGVVK